MIVSDWKPPGRLHLPGQEQGQPLSRAGRLGRLDPDVARQRDELRLHDLHLGELDLGSGLLALPAELLEAGPLRRRLRLGAGQLLPQPLDLAILVGLLATRVLLGARQARLEGGGLAILVAQAGLRFVDGPLQVVDPRHRGGIGALDAGALAAEAVQLGARGLGFALSLGEPAPRLGETLLIPVQLGLLGPQVGAKRLELLFQASNVAAAGPGGIDGDGGGAGRAAVPLRRLLGVSRHAEPVLVQHAEAEGGRGVALLGRAAIPLRRRGVVRRNPQTLLVDLAHVHLGLGVASLRAVHPDLQGGLVVGAVVGDVLTAANLAIARGGLLGPPRPHVGDLVAEPADLPGHETVDDEERIRGLGRIRRPRLRRLRRRGGSAAQPDEREGRERRASRGHRDDPSPA